MSNGCAYLDSTNNNSNNYECTNNFDHWRKYVYVYVDAHFIYFFLITRIL